MSSKFNLKQQFQQNLLAILSIAIAISALAYNSWRNEQSEENRNLRAAGFEIMKESARLQYLVDSITYTSSNYPIKQQDTPIVGWVTVNQIVSLSQLMMPEVKGDAEQLKLVWSEHWQDLADDEAANEKVSIANQRLVDRVRNQLTSLK